MMNAVFYFIIILVAFLTSLLDTSYFSFLAIYQASFLLSLAVLVSLSIMGIKRGAVIYATFLILFFAIFSSLPVWLIALLFIMIPLLIFLMRQRLAIDHSKLLLVLTFALSAIIFELSLASTSLDFSKEALIAVISFTIINTLGGLIIFWLTRKIFRLISPFINRVT